MVIDRRWCLLVVFLLTSALQGVIAGEKEDSDYVDALLESGDNATAYAFVRTLAEQGSAYGQFALGGFYLVPDFGVFPKTEENKAIGYEWLRKSANQGYEEAILHLKLAYRIGAAGAPKNASYERDVWLRRAASKGDVAAQRYIADEKKGSALIKKLHPNYKSPWLDPGYAVEVE